LISPNHAISLGLTTTEGEIYSIIAEETNTLIESEDKNLVKIIMENRM